MCYLLRLTGQNGQSKHLRFLSSANESSKVCLSMLMADINHHFKARWLMEVKTRPDRQKGNPHLLRRHNGGKFTALSDHLGSANQRASCKEGPWHGERWGFKVIKHQFKKNTNHVRPCLLFWFRLAFIYFAEHNHHTKTHNIKVFLCCSLMQWWLVT